MGEEEVAKKRWQEPILVQVGPYNRLQNDDVYTYQHDNEGNLIRKTYEDGDYTIYAWDHRNRLTQVDAYNSEDELTSEAAFFYDAFNQLITDSSGRTLMYDGGQAVLQFSSQGDLTHRYLWGAEVDQLLADEQVDWTDSDADGEVLWEEKGDILLS